MWLYFFSFLGAFILSYFFTLICRKTALKLCVVDDPNKRPERKIHKKPIALLGGTAIFCAFNLVVLFNLNFLVGGYLLPKYLWGIFLGGLIIIVGGAIDDKFDLKPKYQIIFPVFATLIIILSGIGIEYISNPLGGIVYFKQLEITLLNINGLPYKITLLADIFTLLWMIGMMYTTKILDGLDGLVSGITVIGSFVIFCLSLSSEVNQPETAMLAIILAGAALGFWLLNFYPAKIYLGEGGSLFAGFMLGVLAIISGGKIATALLIMGIPILDLAWVIIRRFFIDKKSPFKTADKKHLHFQLLDIGFTHRQAVLFLYLLTTIFGAASLILKGQQKIIALIFLLFTMVFLAMIIYKKYRQNSNNLV